MFSRGLFPLSKYVRAPGQTIEDCHVAKSNFVSKLGTSLLYLEIIVSNCELPALPNQIAREAVRHP